MKKSLISIGAITLLSIGSATALADDLTIPHQFVSGTPAVAADVNANFAAVEAAVDDNDTRITTNTNAIATNAATIANKADAADVAANTADIAANTADIAGKAGVIHGHAGEDITSGTVNEARIDPDITRDSEVVSIVNAANIDADTLDGIDSTEFAAAAHSHSGTDITSGTVAEPRIADEITRDSEVMSIVNAEILDADTLDGFDSSDFAQKLVTDDHETRISALEEDCPTGMTRVGPTCVDTYEASVWDNATDGLQLTVVDNTNPCDDNGSDCKDAIYARSVAGVTPARGFTWFQAVQACANVGKRLLTNQEWQMAVAGTPNSGDAETDPEDCVTDLSNTGPENTGSRDLCVSSWGVHDMVGNIHEWVADWMQGGSVPFGPNGGPNIEPGFGEDTVSGTNSASTPGAGSTNFPAAIYRGGKFDAGSNAGMFAFSATRAPSVSDPGIGFRCAR